MAGVIVSLAPAVQAPVGSTNNNPSALPSFNFPYAVPGLPQTWTGLQTFKPLKIQYAGSISGTTFLNASANASGTLTLPAATDTLVGQATFDTLTNKQVGNRRVITAPGNVTVDVNDSLIILAKTVAQATQFFLPADNTKFGPVKIVDFNGVGGTFAITIVPNGTETISGQASWTLGAYASVVLSPTGAGLGYGV